MASGGMEGDGFIKEEKCLLSLVTNEVDMLHVMVSAVFRSSRD